MSDILLQVKQLSIQFHTEHGAVPVLKNISFTLARGETLALVGESGGGKTLTGLAIMQLLPAAARVYYQSEILLGKINLLNLPEITMRKVRGKRIGMIFQEAMTALNPVLTIEEQIDEVLCQHFHLSHKNRHEKILALLTEVGIHNPAQLAKLYPHELSGGLRQRAMIAIALAGEPDLLIADEPTTALDVTVQAQVLHLLKTIQQQRNMSLLFITHDLGVVAQIADQVAVIYHGEIVEYTDTKKFFTHPEHAYSRHLFAALPTFEKRPIPPRAIPADEEPILNVTDLKIYFPIHKGVFRRTVGHIKAVDDVDLAVYPGRTLALVGESGSGKTTLSKGILRLLPLTGGSIQYLHQDLVHLSKRELHKVRSELPFVFQDPFSSMDPRMTVFDIISEGMAAQGIGTTLERQARVDELLGLVGLDIESKWRYPHEFSGGQRQRICIARSLALTPKLLICDEPTSALDVSVQMQLLQLLLKLQEELGIAYLLITHNFAVVSYLADEVAVMHEGKIVEYGNVADVLMHPQHPYTKELLAAVPKVPMPKDA